MEVFHWIVDVGSAPELEMRFKEAQFGNGFSQTVGDGLNPTTEKWSVSIFGMRQNVKPAYDFLKRHGGHKAFRWTTPLGDTLTVYGREVTMPSNGADTFTLNATFVEAPRPE